MMYSVEEKAVYRLTGIFSGSLVKGLPENMMPYGQTSASRGLLPGGIMRLFGS
jgi:hypothetical protein